MAGEPAGVWNVVGHEWTVDHLRRAVDANRLSHAYLFVGPPQVGKRTLALELARAINCDGEPKPCGECRPCQLVLHNAHPDIEVIRGQGSNSTLLVDQVRALRREATLSPVEARYRVYILCGMESANVSASNALLKILEEPPLHVIWLLTATSEELVTPTIVSRCQVLPLGPQPRQVIAQALEKRWQVPSPKAELLARLSCGRMGRAVTLLTAEEPLARRAEALDLLMLLLSAHPAERFQQASKLAQHQERIPEVLESWLSWWRDLLLIKQGLPDRITNLDRQADLEARQAVFASRQIRDAMVALQSCAEHLQKNVGTRLTLEWLMLHLPSARA